MSKAIKRAHMEIGSPYPLGATTDGFGTNFAVFSANADTIELCLFDPAGRREIARYVLPECTDEVWHGYLPGVHAGQLYGYRAYGPYEPEKGHRFNPHKLLLDPYARLLHGQLRWTDALYGYRVGHAKADLTFDRRDSAVAMPKGVVTDNTFKWGRDRMISVPWDKTVFYEAHVKGLTMKAEQVPAHQRGTFAGLADPFVIDHLVKLGVTSLELLPVHANVQDRRLIEKGMRNYWGYNTLSYFAPEPSYLSNGLDEMRRAIHQLHEAGIEVILDVVYNHTCEESELGPTLSFRGLDNASYYRLLPDNPRHCINDTGCGNTVNMSHPRVIQLVMDSLRYWVQEFHVDGFRFDLGVTLGREATGFDPGCGFFDALRQDPVLSQVKLISEPWDIGPGGYQIGNHPAGFAEWNGRYRDDMRRFWKGDSDMRGAIAARLLGSADLFCHNRRRPWASVNFLTAHDGFTLQDLVSYNDKHNEANGEENRDGANDNESFNWGAEGPTDDAGILATREKVKRAMLMTLMFSNGTPMLLGGDEFGRSQQGNNNAYCHDDELSWFDWSVADSDAGHALIEFTAECIATRLSRPTLHAAHFYSGDMEVVPGLCDINWFDESGALMDQDKWAFSEGRLLACRRVARAAPARGDDGEVSATLLLVNADSVDHEFVLPEPVLDWIVLVDAAEQTDGPAVRKPQDNRVTVASHSALLLVADHVAL